MDGRGILAGLVLASLVAWSAPTAVTNRLTCVLSGTDGDQQTLASTNWTDGCVAHADADYLVDLTSSFRLPVSTPLVFDGNSIQLGTDKARATLASKVADVTFAHDGLFLKNVLWDHWMGGKAPRFHGRVTVLSTQAKPARFVTGSVAATHVFTGPWFATAGCGVWLSTSSAAAQGHTLRLTGDLSGFAGRFRVTSGAVLELATTDLPGEVLLETNGTDGLGAGTLALVDAASQVRLDRLTLGAGAVLAFKMAYEPKTGGFVNNSIEVRRQVSITGQTVISVPQHMTCLATSVQRRFPVLVRDAAAAGELNAADFVLSNAVDGVSLEVETDANTGNQMLFVVLAASARKSPQIAYEDFGAVGDGRTDDFAAIVAAHAEANRLHVPVRARDDAVYFIGGAAATAIVQTDVDWGRARFTIDDTSVSNRNRAVFRIAPTAETRSLACPAAIRRGERNLGVAVGQASVVVAENANKRQFIREGNNQNDGTSQSEVYLVDANGVVDAAVPMTWDFETVTALTAVPVDADRLTVKGGVFTTIANQEASTYSYFSRGISILRSNVRLEGLRHEVAGEGDHGAPYGGFIKIDTCANVEVVDCVLTAHKIYKTIGSANEWVSMGTYDINVDHAINVLIRDCRQTTDILDTSYWGIHTSNFCKNMTLDGCVFSRFDDHQGIHNATIRNCTFGHQGIRGDGWGVLRIENTEVESSKFIELRSDYGSTWTGEIIIRNCRLSPPTGGRSQPTLLAGSYTGFHDFGYPCRLPWRITVDGLTIDDFRPYSSYRGPYLFGNFTPANTNAAFAADYPFEVTDRVCLRDISTTSGRGFQKSSNAWMFRNVVVVTNEPPVDCAFTVSEPVLGWNATNATLAVDVTAFDATAMTNAQLVVTMQDANGTVLETQSRSLAAAGVQSFNWNLPANDASYSYRVEVLQNGEPVVFATAPTTESFYAGCEAAAGEGFSAGLSNGVPWAVHGAWEKTPSVGEGRFQIDGTNVFTIASGAQPTNRLIRVEAEYRADELLPFNAYPPPCGVGSLAASRDGSRTCWRGVRAGEDGSPAWFTLFGAEPTSNVSYRIRMEADFSVVPPHVHYAVRETEEGTFTDLVDADGTLWHPCAETTATALAQAEFTGWGSTKGFEGIPVAAAVAEVDGVGYADFCEALSVAAEKSLPLTVLLDLNVTPNRTTEGAEISWCGHRLVWTDAAGWGLVYDSARGRFRMVKVPAGGFPNGLSSYDSYMLGLDAGDSASRPLVTICPGEEGTFQIELNVQPPEDVAATIRYRLESAADPSFADSVLGPAVTTLRFVIPSRDSPTRFFRIRAEF